MDVYFPEKIQLSSFAQETGHSGWFLGIFIESEDAGVGDTVTLQAFWGSHSEKPWNPSGSGVAGGVFLLYFPEFSENRLSSWISSCTNCVKSSLEKSSLFL